MSLFHAGFTPGSAPARVRFARGGRHDLTPELDALNTRRALVLTMPHPVERNAIRALLQHAFDDARPQ